MHHFFVPPEQIEQRRIFITGSDVNHIRHVLRMREGDELRVCTGEDDRDFKCRIHSFTGSGESERIELEILWVEHTRAELPCRITLFQGLPKGDKMETIIQKNVELGIFSVVPVQMHRSVVKIKEGKGTVKVQRWNAIAQSAAKQSKRMQIPRVEEILTFSQALDAAKEMDTILFPYELAADMQHTRQTLAALKEGERVGVFIGPEGGFEEKEADALIAAGARVITLGKRILRTETAGMALLAMLGYVLEDRW